MELPEHDNEGVGMLRTVTAAKWQRGGSAVPVRR